MNMEHAPNNKVEQKASDERQAHMSTIVSGFEQLSAQIKVRDLNGYERFVSDEDLTMITEQSAELRVAADTGNEDQFDTLLDNLAKSFSGFNRNNQPEGIYDDTDSLGDLKATLQNLYGGFEAYAGELSGDGLSRKYELILKIHSAYDFMSRLQAAGEKVAGNNPESAPVADPESTDTTTVPGVEVINEPVQKAERGETVASFVKVFSKLNSLLTQRNKEGFTLFFTDNTLKNIPTELANFETVVTQGTPEEITKSLQNIFTLFDQFGHNTERTGRVLDNIQSLREVEATLQSIHNSLGVLYRLYEKETVVPVSDPVLAGINKVGQRISRAKNDVTERIYIARSILER